jgi:beta-glucosidase
MARRNILARVAVAALIAGTPALAQAQTDRMPYREKSTALEKRIEDLMARLTLEEKVSLLAGESSMTLQSIPRLGIPAIKVTDGPTGVRSPEGKPATVFPVGVAIAATWNPELAKAVGAAIAEESRGYGASVLLAPTVNIVRTPRWGRNFETYSEDPLLAGKLGKGVGVSIKHFAANNQETNRFFVDSIVDERTLREIYLPAFEMVVKQADPWSVMASYNKVNGTYASENRWLLTDLLKKEWGYRGFVVSDWGATHSTAPAVNAGLDLEMPGPAQKFGEKLLAAVRAGEVTQAQLDDNARRIVRLIVRSGALDGPLPKGEIGGEKHRAAQECRSASLEAGHQDARRDRPQCRHRPHPGRRQLGRDAVRQAAHSARRDPRRAAGRRSDLPKGRRQRGDPTHRRPCAVQPHGGRQGDRAPGDLLCRARFQWRAGEAPARHGFHQADQRQYRERQGDRLCVDALVGRAARAGHRHL